jgi:hypothetical protein
MTDPSAELRDLVRLVATLNDELEVRRRTLPPDAVPVSDPTGRDLSSQVWAARQRLDTVLASAGAALERGDAWAVDAALTYLKLDPYYMGSGYARSRLCLRLARQRLNADDQSRARRLVLGAVDGVTHCAQPAIGRLAASVANNELRRELRIRLHSSDASTAHRALRTIVRVRHPGVAPADLQVIRTLILDSAGNGIWLSPDLARLARWAWSAEWERELRELTRHHGPWRSGAKRLLWAAEQKQRRTRPGP